MEYEEKLKNMSEGKGEDFFNTWQNDGAIFSFFKDGMDTFENKLSSYAKKNKIILNSREVNEASMLWVKHFAKRL